MLYLDTSVIAALLFNEPEYGAVEKELEDAGSDGVCLSAWTNVEVFSSIAQRLRMKRMSRSQAASARHLYESEFSGYSSLPITAETFRRAKLWLAHDALRLRAGDALHLAVASARRDCTVLTLDKDMLKAAQALRVLARNP